MNRLLNSFVFGASICAGMLIIGLIMAVIKGLLNGIPLERFISLDLIIFGLKKISSLGIVLSIFYFIANPHKQI